MCWNFVLAVDRILKLEWRRILNLLTGLTCSASVCLLTAGNCWETVDFCGQWCELLVNRECYFPRVSDTDASRTLVFVNRLNSRSGKSAFLAISFIIVFNLFLPTGNRKNHCSFNPLAATNAFEKLDVTARNNVIDWRHLRAFPLTSYLRRIFMYFNGV